MKKLFAERIVFLMIFLAVPACANALENSIWIEAIGSASQGDVDTLKEVKDRAKHDAQLRAIEKAVGVFVKSHTLVSNNQIAEDLVYAAVRGKINKMEILNEGWDEKDRAIYQVKLKALVDPILPDQGQGLQLKLSLAKSILKEGEETRVFYQSSADCYVYIFSIAADGSVTLLLPNSISKDNRVMQDKTYEFPPSDSAMKLQAMFLPDFNGEVTEERIKIIATKRKEALIPLGFQEGMFQIYNAKSTGMISDLVKKLNQLDPADWAETTVAYKIVR
jgi:hypothetical protein